MQNLKARRPTTHPLTPVDGSPVLGNFPLREVLVVDRSDPSTSKMLRDWTNGTVNFVELSMPQPCQAAKLAYIYDNLSTSQKQADFREQIIEKAWSINSHPDLILHLLGAAKDLPTASKLSNLFESLVEVAKRSGAWIVADGLQRGIGQQFGLAVGQNLLESSSNLPADSVMVFGSSSIHEINKSEDLKEASRKSNFKLQRRVVLPSEPKRFSLNANFGHHVVFDGENCAERLVDLLSRFQTEPKPKLGILLGGCVSDLKHLNDNHQHLLVIKGSGGLADVLATAHEMTYEKTSDHESAKVLLQIYHQSRASLTQTANEPLTPSSAALFSPPLSRRSRSLSASTITTSTPSPEKQSGNPLLSSFLAQSHPDEIEFDKDFEHKVLLHPQMLFLIGEAEHRYQKQSTAEQILRGIRKLMTHCRKRISILDINSMTNDQLPSAILDAILKDHASGSRQINDIFELAIKWNRPDVCRQLLTHHHEKVSCFVAPNLHSLVVAAIMKGQNELVVLLEEFGLLNARLFINLNIIAELYDNLMKEQKAILLLKHESKSFRQVLLAQFIKACESITYPVDKVDKVKFATLKGVGDVLANKLGCYLDNLFDRQYFIPLPNSISKHSPLVRMLSNCKMLSFKSQLDASYNHAFRDCLLFALLQNHDNLAAMCWLRGVDQIGTALLASRLFEKLSKEAHLAGDQHSSGQLRLKSKLWCDRAMDTTTICYQKDASKTTKLLRRGLPTWQDCTVLEIAHHADQKVFMGHPAVQTFLNQVWRQVVTSLSPRAKFYVHFLANLLFLSLISCFTVIGPDPFDGTFSYKSVVEICVWEWACASLLERFVESFGEKLLNHWHERFKHFHCDRWNYFDLIGFSLLVAFRLALWPGRAHHQSLLVRTLLGLSCFVYWFKIFRSFYASSQLGPKVTTLFRMIWDVLFFAALYLILLMAFSVPIYVMMYPSSPVPMRGDHQNFYPVVFDIAKIMYQRIWSVVGTSLDQNREQIEGNCTSSGSIVDPPAFSLDQPCSATNYVAIILLFGYLILTGVVLLNMLIAMLSYTVDTVRDKSLVLWHYYRYQLTYEYYHKTILPPPINFLEWTADALRRCCKTSTKHIDCAIKYSVDQNQPPTLEDRRLEAFERRAAQKMLENEH